MKGKEESEKVCLKLNIQKTKIMASSPISSVQFSSVTQSCPTLCDPMSCSMPGLSVQHQLPEPTQTHVHWVNDANQPSHPLSSPSPAFSLSSIRVFWKESALHTRWPKSWSFSFNISPSNEHPGLIFFRMNWLDILPVQGTLKSLLQHHSSKASLLLHSAFFIVQLSYPYMANRWGNSGWLNFFELPNHCRWWLQPWN